MEEEEEKGMAMAMADETVSEGNGSVEVEEGGRRRAMAGGFQKMENLGEGSRKGILVRGLHIWASLSLEN